MTPAAAPPMTEAEGVALVERLLAAYASRAPVDVPDGFAERCSDALAQWLHDEHVRRRLARDGGTLIGAKLGGTSEAAFRVLGIDTPFVGPIFSARTHTSPARLPLASFVVGIVEPEIGVLLKRDLDVSVVPSREQLLDAIEAAFPVIELADARIAGWSAPPTVRAVVADAGYAGAWVRAATPAGWRATDLRDVAVALTHDGVLVREGRGASVLGDPLHALALAAADLARRGRALRAGQFVSTGSFTPPYPLPRAGRLVADFGAFGRVELELG